MVPSRIIARHLSRDARRSSRTGAESFAIHAHAHGSNCIFRAARNSRHGTAICCHDYLASFQLGDIVDVITRVDYARRATRMPALLGRPRRFSGRRHIDAREFHAAAGMCARGGQLRRARASKVNIYGHVDDHVPRVARWGYQHI